MIFDIGVTYKYVLYAVKNEIQMRSANFISVEDMNNKGDPITKIKSRISNVTDVDCFRKTHTCVVSGNNLVQVFILSSIGINLLSSVSFTEKTSVIQSTRLAAIQGSNYFLAASYAEFGVMR